MEHEYNDWQMHFEDCPDCKTNEPCPKGKEIQERLAKKPAPSPKAEF